MSQFVVTATQAELDTLRRLLRKINSIQGAGSNSPYGVSLARELASLAGPPPAQPRPPHSWFRIDTATATGVNGEQSNPVQWTYGCTEMVKTETGYGGWTVLEDGFVGTGYNPVEDINGASGVQGNGVDHGTDLYADNDFDMSPITVGLTVPGEVIYVGESQVAEAWFWPIPNGEDGECA